MGNWHLDLLTGVVAIAALCALFFAWRTVRLSQDADTHLRATVKELTAVEQGVTATVEHLATVAKGVEETGQQLATFNARLEAQQVEDRARKALDAAEAAMSALQELVVFLTRPFAEQTGDAWIFGHMMAHQKYGDAIRRINPLSPGGAQQLPKCWNLVNSGSGVSATAATGPRQELEVEIQQRQKRLAEVEVKYPAS